MDEPLAWGFRSFVSDRRESAVRVWYNGQAPQVQAKFDTTLKYLRDRPSWDRPYVGILHGECEGLIEIRLKVKRVQYRPLGFYGPLKMEFTILFFATERDGALDPPTACSIALGRKTLVLGNREENSCEWPVG